MPQADRLTLCGHQAPLALCLCDLSRTHQPSRASTQEVEEEWGCNKSEWTTSVQGQPGTRGTGAITSTHSWPWSPS